jgi:tripartite-type tricarboxylate transporter receptor subunit TctC
MSRFLLTAFVPAAVLAMASAGAACAETNFPVKPVRIILPVPAGSGLDVVTRVAGQALTQTFGQQVIVENRPGGGGAIAAQAVASAAPDGYTLLGGAASIFQILPAQREKIAVDVDRAFVQVGMVTCCNPMFVAVPPRLGFSAFPQLVALAKSKPHEILIGTNGAGTLPNFAGLAVARQGNIPFTVVPYGQGGTVAAIADIMGGRVHAVIEAVSGLRGQLQSGDLKLIGVMSAERDPEYPEVPTIAESVPGLTAVGFMSLAAPTGTPPAAVRALNEALNAALATPSVKQRSVELSSPIKIMTPAETRSFIESEEKRWWPMVREYEPD